MLIRRCAVLVFEAREHLEFDLATLFAGDQALAADCRWVALAALAITLLSRALEPLFATIA